LSNYYSFKDLSKKTLPLLMAWPEASQIIARGDAQGLRNRFIHSPRQWIWSTLQATSRGRGSNSVWRNRALI